MLFGVDRDDEWLWVPASVLAIRIRMQDPYSVEKVEAVGNELCQWAESLSKLTSSEGLENMRAVKEARATLNQARETYIDVIGTKTKSKVSAIIEASYKGSKYVI